MFPSLIYLPWHIIANGTRPELRNNGEYDVGNSDEQSWVVGVIKNKEFTTVLVTFGLSISSKEGKSMKDDGSPEARSQESYIYMRPS